MPRTLRLLVLLCCAVYCAACTAPPTPQPNRSSIPVRLLESWQPQQDTLTAQDAAREWRFNGQQGDAIVLSLAAENAADVSLALRDSAGNALVSGSDIRFTLPANDIYTAFVWLASGDAASYTLTLGYSDRQAPTHTPSPSLTPTFTVTPSATLTPTFTLTPSQTPTPSPTYTPSFTLTPSATLTPVYSALGTLTGDVQIGTITNGAFLSEFERHIYLFAGVADQQVTISMQAMSGSVDPVLTLYDPAGIPLATDDNSGGDRAALLRDIRLPITGKYVIQALGGGTGSYRLSLQSEAPALSGAPPTATPTPPLGTVTPVAASEQLDDHIVALDVIDRPGGFVRYFIDAQAGDFLTLTVRPAAGSPLRPRVELYTPAGELMFLSTLSNGQAYIPSLPVPETGRYGVFVNDDGRTGGAYTIVYGLGNTFTDHLRGALPPEQPGQGSGLLTVRDVWTLPLAEGDVISVDAPGIPLHVTSPDGEGIASATGAVQFTAPLSGDYRLYASGSYSLVWRYLVAAPTPAAPLLILSADDPLPGQSYLTYPFQGAAGARIRVRVEALNSSFDPVAELLDPSGVSVASGDDSPGSLNPDFRALLPADGTYRLRVNDYAGSGGVVNVTIEMLS